MTANGATRKERTRERILVGAAEILSERGLGATTVEDILGAAGVSRRTFYQHFGNQDGLLVALYTDFVESLIDSIGTALASARSPVRQILDGLDAYLDFEQRGGRLLILLQADAIRLESPLAPVREAAMDRLAALFDDAIAAQAGIRLDPLVYRGLLVLNDGLMIQAQRRGPFSDAERERLRSVMAPIFINVLAGLQHLPKRVPDNL